MKKILENINIRNFIFPISLFLYIVALAFINNYVDMDFWARLLQGNAFWQTGSILKQDPFSYTNTHIWLDHEWGASIIFSFITNLFGYKGIIIFKSIIVFLIFFFIYKIIKLRNTDTFPIQTFVFSLLSLSALTTIVNSWLRCHFFTFLFFAISLYFLENYRKTKNIKNLIYLPIIMLFWVNIHGGCVSLLGILLLYAIGEFLNKSTYKEYLYTLITCLLVMFINPYGIDYVKFIFMATTMQRPFVTEWISPFAHNNWQFLIEFKLLFIFYLFIFLLNIKNIKKDFTKYLLFVVCAYISFKYVKNTPFIIIFSICFFYEDILNITKKIIQKININSSKVLNILYISLILYSLYLIKDINLYPNLYLQPYKIVEFIKVNKLKGNILAPFDMGSYISFKLYPQNLIYMDGRYEEVYYNKTKELLDNFYNVTPTWNQLIQYPDVHNYIIVPQTALLNDYLKKNPNYKIIFYDGINFLYANINNIQKNYKSPTNDNSENYDFYYEKNAFETSVNFEKDLFVVK